MSDTPQTWERQLLEKLIQSTLKEQRRSRRWGIFFKIVFLLYLVFFLFAIWPASTTPVGSTLSHAALIDINGIILPGSKNSADNIGKALRKAFNDKNTLGIILRINSPGGAPVQADYIFNEIRRLRQQHRDIKVYAVCEDVCASGAYYIAAAADDIYANPSSLVGSIGVMINSFGFVDTMQKLGIQRRLLIAGKNKGILDPFSPMDDQQKQYIQTILNQAHQEFINAVELGRGNRLQKSDPTIFSGLVYSGVDAKQLGLIDGFMSAGQVAREILRTDNIIDYTIKPSFFDRFYQNIGASAANVFLSKLSTRMD